MHQSIKQSSNQPLMLHVCVCMCMWHVLAECVVCLCMCIQIKHNKPIKSITSSKHGLYTIHTYMHVYIMCALSVCVCVKCMHMHVHCICVLPCCVLISLHVIVHNKHYHSCQSLTGTSSMATNEVCEKMCNHSLNYHCCQSLLSKRASYDS